VAKQAVVGDVVNGRYLLRREIAKGGMGAVFEAEEAVTGRVLAVKLVHRGTRHTKISEERLIREAEALSSARHPGIVEVVGSGVCPQAGPYLALEMLIGRTLDGIVAARRRLPLADVAHIGRQICEALAFVHRRGIIHRDLKPSNVFVAHEGKHERVLLFDFGIAATADRSERKITVMSELIGTPEYMAPEQLFEEGEVDQRCDVYSVGVTLFECLTGDVPFSGTLPQVLMKIAQSPGPPSLRALRDDVSEDLEVIMQHALARDPNERFANAAALGNALARATGYTSGETTLLHDVGPVTPAAKNDEAPSSENAPVGLVRRLLERVPYVTVVEIEHEGEYFDGRSEDISIGGMLVRTGCSVPATANVLLRMVLPITNEQVELAATIRWSRAARGGGFAVGVQFAELAEGVRGVIAKYVQQPQA
jgi:uncharacterized protein (TIGR02266 family)